MRVIGTAGHVDHGKSTLVQALTGIHPDRLKEEREREMTIDLGFAWLTLPDGEEIGIVDVPGHRDFIENMLAGVGGIDAALFVVAADEGVMPQTREHLSILDLLQIQGGVVALTKTDMIDEDGREEWIELVSSDLRTALAGSVMATAAIVPVSARTGAGIPELLAALSASLSGRPPRPDLGRPRLPVDRIFTMSGFGTVVTGTLSDGALRVGDEVEVQPQGLRGRVRGLQTHKRKEDTAAPGSRTAVNLSGVSLEDIRRGDVVAHPGDYRATQRVDVRFRLLPDASQSLKHNVEVKLFTGAAETTARVRLLGLEELPPGEEGWLQLELEQPVVTVRGDRYILRRPSPGETLGGGAVVDPHPKGRHKRFSPEVLGALESLSKGTPAEILLQSLVGLGAAPLKDAIDRSNLDNQAAFAAVSELLATSQLVLLDDPALAFGQLHTPDRTPQPAELVAGRAFWESLSKRTIQEVVAYHQHFPLRPGIPKEELRSRLKTSLKGSTRLFAASLRRLVTQGDLQETGPLVLCPGHTVRFTPEQQRSVDRLLERFAASPYAPPSVKEGQAEVGEDVFSALLDLGWLVLVAPDVVFRKEDYDHMVAEVRKLLEKSNELTAAQVRDHFNTSRRYALALLEHLDSAGVTIRQGDVRRLRR